MYLPLLIGDFWATSCSLSSAAAFIIPVCLIFGYQSTNGLAFTAMKWCTAHGTRCSLQHYGNYYSWLLTERFFGIRLVPSPRGGDLGGGRRSSAGNLGKNCLILVWWTAGSEPVLWEDCEGMLLSVWLTSIPELALMSHLICGTSSSSSANEWKYQLLQSIMLENIGLNCGQTLGYTIHHTHFPPLLLLVCHVLLCDYCYGTFPYYKHQIGWCGPRNEAYKGLPYRLKQSCIHSTVALWLEYTFYVCWICTDWSPSPHKQSVPVGSLLSSHSKAWSKFTVISTKYQANGML